MTNGIDVSIYQGDIDWKRVKADFVIIRAGYGSSAAGIDEKFQRNYTGCEENEIPKGCYWFSYAVTPEEAAEEARAMLSVIRGKRFEYPIYYDVENRSQFRLGKSRLSEIIRTFIKTLEAEGYMAGLYMSAYYLNTVVEEDIINTYPIWVADYSIVNSFNGKYGIWQYGIAGSPQFNTTGAGYVPGVDGECDLDRCYINYPEKIKTLGLNGYTKAPEARKTITELAHEVLLGDWGNGQERRERLTNAGYNYERVQQKVDELLIEEVAAEVIQGKWGNGEERRQLLTRAGYNYSEVQSAVNRMLAG